MGERTGPVGVRAMNLVVAGLAGAGVMLAVLSPEPPGRPTGAPGTEVGSPVRGSPVPAPSTDGLEGFRARVAALERAVGAAPDDRARRLELARLLHDGHRAEEALPHYRRAVELDPDEPSAVFDLAGAYLTLGRWDDARAVLEARLARAPGDAMTLYNLGVVDVARGDSAEARRWWERARAAAGEPSLAERIERSLERLSAEGLP